MIVESCKGKPHPSTPQSASLMCTLTNNYHPKPNWRPNNNRMHYHLIGICGPAMAALAAMLQARGHQVTGSDENVSPPMSTMLASLGISVMKGYRPEHLEPAPDCVIVGNAIPRGNAELEATLNRKL